MVEGETEADGVVVPTRVYKVVTVFSTTAAAVLVVAGFLLIDVATERATAPPEEVNTVLAIFGVGVIVSGAALYAFSTRFHTAEMETANNGDAQSQRDG